MMKKKPIILALSVLMVAFTVSNNPPVNGQTTGGGANPAAPNHAFQHGELLTYKIYYNLNFVWIPAGEVSFQVFDEGAQYHYKARGETYDSYEWFFAVKDEYDSWVDKNTLLPNYSERNINEGKYTVFEKVSYNQQNRKTTVWRSRKRGMTETRTEHYVQDNVFDVLSTLYHLRNIDFAAQQPGYTAAFRIFMDKEEYPLSLKYMGKENRKKVHGGGRFNTLKFRPQVIAGNVFNEDSAMTVWVSDDLNRIPVMIESPVSVGSIKMVIKDWQNLRFEMTAKQK